MWIIGQYGFISLVQHRDDPEIMQVRARVREDILMYFPGVEIEMIVGADYLYRANVPRNIVAETVAAEILGYTVTSHVKDVAVQSSQPNAYRQSAYYACWRALAEMQPYAPYSRLPRAEEKRLLNRRVGVRPWANDMLPFEEDMYPSWDGPTQDIPELEEDKQPRDKHGRFASKHRKNKKGKTNG
jgi:hypothetical protein